MGQGVFGGDSFTCMLNIVSVDFLEIEVYRNNSKVDRKKTKASEILKNMMNSTLLLQQWTSQISLNCLWQPVENWLGTHFWLFSFLLIATLLFLTSTVLQRPVCAATYLCDHDCEIIMSVSRYQSFAILMAVGKSRDIFYQFVIINSWSVLIQAIDL